MELSNPAAGTNVGLFVFGAGDLLAALAIAMSGLEAALGDRARGSKL